MSNEQRITGCTVVYFSDESPRANKPMSVARPSQPQPKGPMVAQLSQSIEMQLAVSMAVILKFFQTFPSE